LKQRLQKAAAEVQEEQDKAKKKGPTTGQKVLRGGLAALGGGVAGAGLGALVGNRVGGGIASEGYKNAVVPWMIGNAREKTPLTKPVERFKLETEDIPNLRKATPVVQSGLKTLGTAGGAALGAGGGALLGLALYLAFRRTGG